MTALSRMVETPTQYEYDVEHAALHSHPLKVVVAYRNQFFSFSLFHDGERLTPGQIEGQLNRIVSNHTMTHYPAVGLLTSLDRDTWAPAYKQLRKSVTNSASLNAIESALAVFSLDTGSLHDATSAIRMGLHGGGSGRNSGNRWFDKSYQIVASENGVTASNVEHTVGDGLPFFRVCVEMPIIRIQYMYYQIAEWTLSEKHVFGPERPVTHVAHPTQLHWKLTNDDAR